MKLSFTRLLAICLALLTFQISLAQAVGDYRSVSPSFDAVNNQRYGTWKTLAAWERFDGTSWVPAPAFPTSADGVITIRTGDSIALTTTTINIDQVVVEPGASLSIFSITATLNDAAIAGDDIIVNGNGADTSGLYLATSGILTTSTGATVQVNSGGMMQIRNGGNLQVNTTSSGELQFSNNATITSATITSNGTSTWISGTITLSNGVFVNNGTMTIVPATNTVFTSGGAGTTNSVTNSATGIIRKINSSGTAGTNNANSGVSFTNSGTLTGVGTYQFLTAGTATVTSNGIITPGNNGVGTLNLQSNILINTQTPTLTFELVNLSGAGTGNDLLALPVNADLTGSVIKVIDNSFAAPIGTYTVMTTTGTFTGTADFSQLPTNYIGIQNATNVQIQKTAMFPLPVVWGSFTATAKNNQVKLSWTTLDELNTSHFVVEHSVDGRSYTAVGEIQAKGNQSVSTEYNLVHTTPDLGRLNLYRIKEVDIDGKFIYSAIRAVRFEKGRAMAVLATPNPVHDVLQVTVQERVNILISDMNGRILRKLTLGAGYHPVDVQSLQKGVYQLSVYRNNELVDVQKLVKQ
jgi:hypothetical protein